MEDINDYWKMMQFQQQQQQAPVFTNIDWNQNNSHSEVQPMDFDKVIPPQQQQPFQPFQRRRSSSVDLPINPLYLNTMNREATIQEEEQQEQFGEDFFSWFPTTVDDFDFTRMNRIGSSATLEFPGFNSNPFIFNNNNNNNNNQQNNNVDSTTAITGPATVISSGIESPPALSTTSSDNNEQNMMSSPPNIPLVAPNTPVKKPPSPSKKQLTQEQQQQQQQQQTITFFPELHRTSYNTILGKQLKQHQKRRRSSSLPPAFSHKQKQQHTPTPLIFTQIQVTDPTPPIHHATKKSKQPQDTRPVAIERVHKPVPKPQVMDPIETQKKLEQDLLVVNFEDVTVAELKEMLRERGLPATGKKAILTERLRDARDLLLKGKWISATTSQTAIRGEGGGGEKKETVAVNKPAITEKAVALTSGNNHQQQQQQQKKFIATVSPHIQGIANMSIHSPLPPPPNENFFLPMDQDCDNNNNNFFNDIDSTVYPAGDSSTSDSIKMESSVLPNQPKLDNNSHYQYQSGSHAVNGHHENELLDINDIFNFDSTNSMLDTTAILFPPPNTAASSSSSSSTWDCDNKYDQQQETVNNNQQQQQQQQQQPNITPGNEWDQDKLDLFLTEFV